jgi:hypothetical protein
MPALVLCSAGNFGSFLLASQPESGELIHSPVATSPGNLAGLAVIASVNDFMLNRTPDPEQLSPIDPSLNPACTMSVSASLSKGDSFPTPPRPVRIFLARSGNTDRLHSFKTDRIADCETLCRGVIEAKG